jgi:hypothetical protein
LYFIPRDVTPRMPAEIMGIPYVQSYEILIGTPIIVDLFQFTNRINGLGPLGFRT